MGLRNTALDKTGYSLKMSPCPHLILTYSNKQIETQNTNIIVGICCPPRQ